MRDIRIRVTTNYRSGPRRGDGIRSAISALSTESKRRLCMSKLIDRNAVASAWYRIVGSCDPKHLQAGTRIELFRKFAARGSDVPLYAAKIEQKTVPAEFQNVGRFWGTWGNPPISRKVTLPLRAAKHVNRTRKRPRKTS